MKPAKVSPFEAAISRASAMASAGVSTPARFRPVSHSTTTESGLDPRDVALDAVHVDDSGGRAIFAGDLGGEGGGHQVDSNFSILVIASEAEQSTFPRCRMDCFVAALLAMTPESIPWLKLVRSLHVTLQAPAICLRPPANPFALS